MAEAYSALFIENSLKKMLSLGQPANKEIEPTVGDRISEEEKQRKKLENSSKQSVTSSTQNTKVSTVQHSDIPPLMSQDMTKQMTNSSLQDRRKEKKKRNGKVKPRVQAGSDSILCENDMNQNAVTGSAESFVKSIMKNSVNSENIKSIQQVESPGSNDGRINSSSGDSSVRLEPSSVVDASLVTEKMPLDLEAAGIFLLKKKSATFQNAKYFCRLCEYHCDTIAICNKHVTDARHVRLQLKRDETESLQNLAKPSSQHAALVTECLTELTSRVSLKERDMMFRNMLLTHVQSLVSEISTTTKIVMYGSSLTGFSSVSSDLNLDLQGCNMSSVLCDLYSSMKKEIGKPSGLFLTVKSDFSAKMPCIRAVAHIDGVDDVAVQVTVDNEPAVCTSKLLQVYGSLDARVRPLGLAFRCWAQMCHVDKQMDGSLPGYVFGLMTVYYLQQCRPPVLPVLHEMLETSDTDVNNKENDANLNLDELNQIIKIWKSSNTQNIGQLWISMLRFYALEFEYDTAVVCVRKHAALMRSEKKWTGKKLAVEDPCYRKRNVARSLSHAQIFEFIEHRLRRAFIYFGTPITNSEVPYQFTEETLSDKNGPAVICSICQQQGHTKFACKSENLPPLKKLIPFTTNHLNMLNEVLSHVPNDCQPDTKELHQRDIIVEELQATIRRSYPDARLRLFGSSCNGFGFKRSDLDISMTLEKHSTAESLNCIQIIESLAKLLRANRDWYGILPITTAKVPIVKFTHRRSQLEGDISLYNTLAQHNTRMLLTYSRIDPRVKILGYVIKAFAKCGEICDASRGSLSSYAYILMTLYYLQHTSPPVIPVLQELHPVGKKPEVIVDGWNAWFFDSISSLHSVWPGRGQNHQSIAELWIGLLRFYTEEFNFNDFVISIRTSKDVTKFDKLWTRSRGITIEDPFNLDHNLGGGLSRNMNLFIIKVLRNARDLFGTSVKRIPPEYLNRENYFFDYHLLTAGAVAPNDRGCRHCGKLGHFVKECPVLRNNKGKQKSEAQTSSASPAKSNQSPAKSNQSPPANTGSIRTTIQTKGNTKPTNEKLGTDESEKLPTGSSKTRGASQNEHDNDRQQTNGRQQSMSTAAADSNTKQLRPLSSEQHDSMLRHQRNDKVKGDKMIDDRSSSECSSTVGDTGSVQSQVIHFNKQRSIQGLHQSPSPRTVDQHVPVASPPPHNLPLQSVGNPLPQVHAQLTDAHLMQAIARPTEGQGLGHRLETVTSEGAVNKFNEGMDSQEKRQLVDSDYSSVSSQQCRSGRDAEELQAYQRQESKLKEWQQFQQQHPYLLPLELEQLSMTAHLPNPQQSMEQLQQQQLLQQQWKQRSLYMHQLQMGPPVQGGPSMIQLHQHHVQQQYMLQQMQHRQYQEMMLKHNMPTQQNDTLQLSEHAAKYEGNSLAMNHQLPPHSLPQNSLMYLPNNVVPGMGYPVVLNACPNQQSPYQPVMPRGTHLLPHLSQETSAQANSLNSNNSLQPIDDRSSRLSDQLNLQQTCPVPGVNAESASREVIQATAELFDRRV